MPNPMKVRARRTTAALLLGLTTVQATGCTSWQAVPQPWPAEFRPGRSDPQIRVNLAGASRIVADSARVLQDSLVIYKATFSHVVPLSRVREVETRRFDPLKTLPALLGVGLLAAAVASMASALDELGDSWYLSSRRASSVAPPPELR